MSIPCFVNYSKDFYVSVYAKITISKEANTLLHASLISKTIS